MKAVTAASRRRSMARPSISFARRRRGEQRADRPRGAARTPRRDRAGRRLDDRLGHLHRLGRHRTPPAGARLAARGLDHRRGAHRGGRAHLRAPRRRHAARRRPVRLPDRAVGAAVGLPLRLDARARHSDPHDRGGGPGPSRPPTGAPARPPPRPPPFPPPTGPPPAAMPRAGAHSVSLPVLGGPLGASLSGWPLVLVIQPGTIAGVAVPFATCAGQLWPALAPAPPLARLGPLAVSPVQAVAGRGVLLLSAFNAPRLQARRRGEEGVSVAKGAGLPGGGAPRPPARGRGGGALARGIQHATADRVGTAAMERLAGGSLGATLMALAVMLSTFGCANGLVLAGARVAWAMARDGLFFARAARLNDRHVPGPALWMQGAWASVLALSGVAGGWRMEPNRRSTVSPQMSGRPGARAVKPRPAEPRGRWSGGIGSAQRAQRASTARTPRLSGRPSARALVPADGVWGHRK